MLPDWLNELVDEYAGQKITDARLFRLALAYTDEPPAIMQAAVLIYVRQNNYFPRTAELQPYVRRAHEDARGAVAFADIGSQFTYGRFGHGPYSDDDILAWEQARGTMPASHLLASEWLNGRLRANQKETI